MSNKFTVPSFTPIFVDFMANSQLTDWGSKFMNLKSFYEFTKGEGTCIFVLDTAGQFDHADLIENEIQSLARNFSDSENMMDYEGHGTHVAGIAAAVDNGIGVIGAAPNARLVPIKVLNDEGVGWSEDIADAIRYVADVDIPEQKIINLSLGGSNYSEDIESAIDYAISKSCFIVAAAGNSGTSQADTVDFPGRLDQVITVASLGKSGNPSFFSSQGESVDITAPGEGIFSTFTNNMYASLSGTSMATPYVAGLCALILSYFDKQGNRINHQGVLQTFLEVNAKDIHSPGFDIRTGFGAAIADNYIDAKPEQDSPNPFMMDLRVLFKNGKEVSRLTENMMVRIGQHLGLPVDKKLKKWENKKILEDHLFGE